MKLDVFEDRQKIEDLDRDVRKILKDNDLLDDSDFSVKFCGVIFTLDRTISFLPLGAQACGSKNPNKIGHTISLIDAIEKYERQQNLDYEISAAKADKPTKDYLGLIRELYRDFCEFGIYERKATRRTINQGKPDWKRTLQRTPFPSFKGDPLFFEIDSKIPVYQSNCQIAAIHRGIIKDIDNKHGWLFTKKEKPFAPEIAFSPEKLPAPARQINLLKKEKTKVFTNREIRLINLLISYLSDPSSDGNPKILGYKDFEYVWEHLLREVFNGDETVSAKMPIPITKSKGTVSPSLSNKPRIDIFLTDQKHLTIIDAKYYSGTKDAFPPWSDLVKQFFYKTAAREHPREFDPIENWFVFPGESDNKSIDSIHVQKQCKDEELLDEQFPPIQCYYAKPMVIIRAYVDEKHLDFQELSKKLDTHTPLP
ncbi:LlaJI family restriction endonuclease [Mariniblastus sp.]|nr:LlaJI family restriction endonuclease [Mariniblastus sp.]